MISRRDAVLGAAAVGAAVLIPKGAVADDWLVCNGQVVSRSMYPELFALIGLRYDDREDDGLTFKITSTKGWCIDMPLYSWLQHPYWAIATRPTAQANVGQIQMFFARPLGPQEEFRRWTDEETAWEYGKRSSPSSRGA